MVTYNVKLLMGKAFLAEKNLSFIMKLFHFVCEKRLLNWLLYPVGNCGLLDTVTTTYQRGNPDLLQCGSGI
jgi:hypothetical protein